MMKTGRVINFIRCGYYRAVLACRAMLLALPALFLFFSPLLSAAQNVSDAFPVEEWWDLSYPELKEGFKNGTLDPNQVLIGVNEGRTSLFPPLAFAADEGRARLLLDYGADPNGEIMLGGVSRMPLLSYAILANSPLEVMETLIEYGADVNKANNTGDLPLHYASWSADEIPDAKLKKIIDLLTANGADINAGIEEEWSIIERPMHLCKKDLLAHVIKSGANINYRNKKHGLTPLMMAALARPVMIHTLREQGAEVDAEALYYALIGRASVLTIEHLLAAGGDIDGEYKGKTLLETARRRARGDTYLYNDAKKIMDDLSWSSYNCDPLVKSFDYREWKKRGEQIVKLLEQRTKI